MNLKEFALGINELLANNPQAANFDVVYSIDDEGNGFNLVCCSPEIGGYDVEDKEFDTNLEHNAVCIN